MQGWVCLYYCKYTWSLGGTLQSWVYLVVGWYSAVLGTLVKFPVFCKTKTVHQRRQGLKYFVAGRCVLPELWSESYSARLQSPGASWVAPRPGLVENERRRSLRFFLGVLRRWRPRSGVSLGFFPVLACSTCLNHGKPFGRRLRCPHRLQPRETDWTSFAMPSPPPTMRKKCRPRRPLCSMGTGCPSRPREGGGRIA